VKERAVAVAPDGRGPAGVLVGGTPERRTLIRICFEQSGNRTSHRVARHGAPPRVPETTGGQSRFLTAEADSE